MSFLHQFYYRVAKKIFSCAMPRGERIYVQAGEVTCVIIL